MSGLSLGRPRFLSLDETLVLHQTALNEYGGATGIRDQGLLASALAQPQQGFSGSHAHEFPFGMAAAYAFHIAKNHAFVDGNKRTAWTACGVFLRLNGWNVVAAEDEATQFMLAVAGGSDWPKERIAEWLRLHAKERPSFELRDFFALLGPDQHLAHIQAVTAKKDHEGLLATIGEAGDAIPLIQHLARRTVQLESEGKREEARLFGGMYSVLLSIYRIAEDMGYEW